MPIGAASAKKSPNQLDAVSSWCIQQARRYVGAFGARAPTVLPLTQNKEKFFSAAARRPVRLENIPLKIAKRQKFLRVPSERIFIFQVHCFVIQSKTRKI